ncbi:hypothetical protein G7Y89_g2014 [Cudoniella acicularis]|uniref:DUF7730 domain-containing protein n=1 Tax=Cudoniella acicularis TaxID=354080 RepID=A0A8H4RVY6_9HELO|nr:hypothetical protein G7Y89_g2014 [Cudoniella acicularis]
MDMGVSEPAIDKEERNQQREAKEIEFQRRRVENAPQPLDQVRKKPLSLKFLDLEEEDAYNVVITDVDAGTERTEVHFQYKHPQSKCTILTKFPPNVRQRIWRYTISNHIIAISRGQGCLIHSLQNEEASEIPGTSNTSSRISSLIKTCRQTYNETIHLLYTTNQFRLLQNDNLCDLQRTILPQRFSSIRSLALHWQIRDDETFQRDESGAWMTNVPPPWDIATWETTCFLLKKMFALKQLMIHVRGPFMINQHIEEMLGFLKGLRVPKEELLVVVPWPRVIVMGAGWKEEELSSDFCTVKRRGEVVIPDEDTGPELDEEI